VLAISTNVALSDCGGNPAPINSVARTFPLSMSLLAQTDIEHMREPDACFLQLLPDDRGVHRDIDSDLPANHYALVKLRLPPDRPAPRFVVVSRQAAVKYMLNTKLLPGALPAVLPAVVPEDFERVRHVLERAGLSLNPDAQNLEAVGRWLVERKRNPPTISIFGVSADLLVVSSVFGAVLALFAFTMVGPLRTLQALRRAPSASTWTLGEYLNLPIRSRTMDRFLLDSTVAALIFARRDAAKPEFVDDTEWFGRVLKQNQKGIFSIVRNALVFGGIAAVAFYLASMDAYSYSQPNWVRDLSAWFSPETWRWIGWACGILMVLRLARTVVTWRKKLSEVADGERRARDLLPQQPIGLAVIEIGITDLRWLGYATVEELAAAEKVNPPTSAALSG
jgi:hypothetical protein